MNPEERPDRSHYPVRKFNLHDPEANDDDLSATTTAAERLAMMPILWRHLGTLMGQPADGIRIQRHVTRAYRREG